MKSFVKRSIRTFFQQIATRVQKNDLFEQPGERVRQDVLHIQPDNAPQNVYLEDVHKIKASLDASTGWFFVHHWASWCDGCMEEMEQVKELTSWLYEHDHDIVGVCWELFNGTPPQHALPVISHIHNANELIFKSIIVKDAPEEVFQTLEIEEELIPQFGLYKQGKLVLSHVGVLTSSEIEKVKHVIMENMNVGTK